MGNARRILFANVWDVASAVIVPMVIVGSLMATSVGCGSRGMKVPTPNDDQRLRGVVRTYAVATRNLGRPPEKMEDLKAILAPATDDPDDLVTSSRDGQEFVVVWGLNFASSSPETIIAYERTGVDGKRLVVNLDGYVKELSREEFEKLEFPKNHKPGSS